MKQDGSSDDLLFSLGKLLFLCLDFREPSSQLLGFVAQLFRLRFSRLSSARSDFSRHRTFPYRRRLRGSSFHTYRALHPNPIDAVGTMRDMASLTETRRSVQPRSPFAADLELTPRQLSMLRDLDENRFMTTAHFQRLYGQRAVRDTQFLSGKGYIEQPAAQWVWRRREGGGSRPRVHSLANPGAALLRELRLSSRKRDWAELNGNLSPAWFVLNIAHELAVVDVQIAFRLGVAKRPDHQLLTTEALTGSAVRSLEIPGRKRHTFPDWLPVLTREGRDPVVAPLEVHRGSEPFVRRAQPELSDVYDKYDAYHVYASAERHAADFGTTRFRVLTAVEGGEAMMRTAARTAYGISDGTAPDRFLVTSLAALRGGDPFDVPWLNAAERWMRLEV